MSRARRLTLILIPAGLVAVAVLAVGMYLFQPWKLFVDTTVEEASPLAITAVVSPAAAVESLEVGSPSPKKPETPKPSKPKPSASGKGKVISTGTFISHEHETSGRVQVIQLANGERVLRIENLDTSNGPDLKVWLSDGPVIPGEDGWHVFDDGDYADLGSLKGNKGSQNYKIPAKVDLTDLTSVSVWCARFKVSFGAAELTPSA